MFFGFKKYPILPILLKQKMKFLRSTTSLLRKAILVGWALAVVWIYVGNLVNFHQNHIWGKQLIPVSCYSTRAKEKDALSIAKNNDNSRLLSFSQQFDFSAPAQQMFDVPYLSKVSPYFIPIEFPLLKQGFEALSFRGPPSA
jgi:hypothetical protein